MTDQTKLNNFEDEVEIDPRVKDAEERVARKLGWVPPEEWDRDLKDHVSASEFLERTPKELQKMREERKLLKKTTETMIEDVRRREREAAEREIREAMGRNDAEGVIQATRKAAQAGPDPMAVEWAQRNPWYFADEDAQAYANMVGARESQSGRSPAEQLERIEAAVRKRFPEHFSYDEIPETTRANPVRQQASAPVVQSGNRVSTPPVRQVTQDWKGIPRVNREALEGFVSILMEQSKLDEKSARERIAKRYWSQKDGEDQ
jgi:hypothetical protein